MPGASGGPRAASSWIAAAPRLAPLTIRRFFVATRNGGKAVRSRYRLNTITLLAGIIAQRLVENLLVKFAILQNDPGDRWDMGCIACMPYLR